MFTSIHRECAATSLSNSFCTLPLESTPAIYPNPKILYLEAIKEQVPVFDGTFRITEDVTLSVSKLRGPGRCSPPGRQFRFSESYSTKPATIRFAILQHRCR